MKTRLLALGDVPPRLAEAVLAGLPRPYTGGEVGRLEIALGRCYDRTRAQVDAACLIEQIPEPGPGWLLLGLTGVDLFMPALTYVFGISHLGGRRGIVSWFRLHPEETGPSAQTILIRRITTEVVHELGHSLGLVHCVVPECAMHRSLWPEGVDLKHPEYCPACLETLTSSL
ncbi:MAG: archaemetzincin [Acidobacteriia bacterium]|nr:archaemetzincin [Terriglobia bacterium]